MDEGKERSIEQTASDVIGVGGGAVAGALIGGPVGAVTGAALGPAAARAVHEAVRPVLERWQARQRERAADVISVAAQDAGLDPETLVHRLEELDGGEELFVRTMRAAATSPGRRKLVLLSRALASGASANDQANVAWEAMFVRAVDAIEETHLDLLERFRWSGNRLGLGDGSNTDFDKPVMRMNDAQLKVVLPQFEPVIDSLVATLESQGLLIRENVYGAGQSWGLSQFGSSFLDRLDDVGRTLRNWS
jgi:hypothetical protein